MDNGASFETPGVPGGVQISDERNIFDFSLGALVIHANIEGFGLTPLSGDRRGYMFPLLKTNKTKKKKENHKKSVVMITINDTFTVQSERAPETDGTPDPAEGMKI